MAEFSTQEAGIVLQDDLMRDRARQAVEFLDDVSFSTLVTAFLRPFAMSSKSSSHENGSHFPPPVTW